MGEFPQLILWGQHIPTTKEQHDKRKICRLVSLKDAKILASKLGTMMCNKYVRVKLPRNARLIAQWKNEFK